MLSSTANHSRLFHPWQPVKASEALQIQTATDQAKYTELPEVHSYEELEKHAFFAEIKSRFLSDIVKMKQLAHSFVGDQYDQRIDTFYDKLKSPPEDIFDSLLPLYRETRFQIHRLVQQLKDQQNDSNVASKDCIAEVLHKCLTGIELCPAGVHSRFNHCFLNLEALRAGLDGKLFEVRSGLFRQFIQSFLFEQQREGLIKLDFMEVHYFNGLHNLYCKHLGLSPLVDRFAPTNLADRLTKQFLSAAPLTINACTILRKLSSDWSDLFSANLQEIGVQAWETEVIDSDALIVERTDKLDSGFFKPVNELLKITGEQSLVLGTMIEETGDGRYHFGRYREKLLAWVVSQFCQSPDEVFTAIGGVDSSLYIGTKDQLFFWVFDHDQHLPAGQAYTFEADNHTTLTLAHLTSIDFLSWSENTAYALLTQAMEQTNNAEHIASFFLQQATIKQLRKAPEVVVKTLSNQLSEKLIKNDDSFTEKLCQCVCDHFVAEQTIMAEDSLDWLYNTPLLKPVLLRLQQQAMDVSPIVQNVVSWQISGFSHDEIKKLLSPEDCQRLFKQAFKLKQGDTLSNLLLTAHCDQLTHLLNDDQELPLTLIARAGNLPGLEYLLKLDSSAINHKDTFGFTPLIAAARYGHAECVEALLKARGIDVNGKSSNGFTPLNSAAKYGHAECVEALLKARGIDVNGKSLKGFTPLNSAAKYGHAECVEALLKARGIDVNGKSSNGFTPLNSAALYGHAECVEALLKARGIDVNGRSSNGFRPLNSAAQYGHKKCVQTLLKAPGIDVNGKSPQGFTPLNRAASKGHAECVKVLLKAPGIDVNEKNRDGWAPLGSAARFGHKKCVQALLKAPGIDVNGKSPQGFTPLNSAARYGYAECVKVLLKAEGVDANEKDNASCPPLHNAASAGHAECVKALLGARNIEVNVKTPGGLTALDKATIKGHEECVEALLGARNIEVNVKTPGGLTALNKATIKGHEECVEALLDADNIEVNVETPMGLHH